MQWLRNLSVSRKFTYAFGIVCGLCIVLGSYTFLTFQSIASKNQEVSEKSFPSTVQLAGIRDAVNTLRREDLHLLLCTTPACLTEEGTKREQAFTSYQASAKAYEPLITRPEEREFLQKISINLAAYKESSDHASTLIAAGKTGDALDLLFSDAVRTSLENTLTAANQDLELSVKTGMDSAEAATRSSNRSMWISSGVTLLIVLLCSLIGRILTREIAPRLARVMNALQHLADKDLTASVVVSGTDEMAKHSTPATPRCAPSCSPWPRARRRSPPPPRKSVPARSRAPATPIPSPARPTRLPPRRRR
jgi:methyl-accepting chemotaxis protein